MGNLKFGPRPRPRMTNECKSPEFDEIQQKLLDSGLLNNEEPTGHRLLVRLSRFAAKFVRRMALI